MKKNRARKVIDYKKMSTTGSTSPIIGEEKKTTSGVPGIVEKSPVGASAEDKSSRPESTSSPDRAFMTPGRKTKESEEKKKLLARLAVLDEKQKRLQEQRELDILRKQVEERETFVRDLEKSVAEPVISTKEKVTSDTKAKSSASKSTATTTGTKPKEGKAVTKKSKPRLAASFTGPVTASSPMTTSTPGGDPVIGPTLSFVSNGGQLKQNKTPKTVEMEAVRITRSSPKSATNTPTSLYDFTGESPLTDSNKNSGKKQSQSKADGKKKKGEKAKVAKIKPSSDKQSKVKVGNKKTSAAPSKSTVTPKGRVSKVVIPLENKPDETETKQTNKRLRVLKPIPPPNLDDISPIVRERKSTTPSRKRANDSRQGKNDGSEKKKLRSSKSSENELTGSVSYMESEEGDSADDSAIFVSPRQTMPRFNAAKTSTPTNVSAKSKKMPVKKISKLAAKDTSTPNENKPKRNFTGIKGNISKLSPVQRVDTPTSDYGSMEIVPTPSPTPPVKANRRKRGNSPAFTLEDDDSGENLNLNKSVDRSYYKKNEKSKKKFETGRFSTSKLDEWADKVNSELEDIENFELSVEG